MHQALYRKYRPSDFNSVIGQNPIINTLKNTIKYNKINHAYIFFGPRGTGKTTTAKIFARSINCLDSIDGSSCGKCQNCLHSFEKECVDIIELDAASNNGVDEIREIINNVSLIPTYLKYKVYIIDEVHMLSSGAFNALLKTLEEPPNHVVFILATTEPQKVPETIVSRCQCFSFKRISNELIVDCLKNISKTEKIKIDDDVLEQIAISSNGGMRDSLVLLDQLSSFTDKKIDIKVYSELNGSITYDDIKLFIDYIIIGDIKNIVSIITDLNNNGKNLVLVVNQIINYLRNIIVDKIFDNSNYDIELYIELINYLNKHLIDLKNCDNTRIYLECLIIKFIYDFKLIDNNTVQVTENIDDEVNIMDDNKINSLKSLDNEENNNIDNSKIITNNNPVDKKILNLDEIMNIRINNIFALANKKEKENYTKLKKKFNDFIFDKNFGYIASLIVDSNVLVASSNSVLLGFKYDSSIDQLNKCFLELSDVFEKVLGKNVLVAYIKDSDWDKYANDYVNNIKSGIKYELIDEPDLVFEECEKDDIISSSAISIFGNEIVEIN